MADDVGDEQEEANSDAALDQGILRELKIIGLDEDAMPILRLAARLPHAETQRTNFHVSAILCRRHDRFTGVRSQRRDHFRSRREFAAPSLRWTGRIMLPTEDFASHERRLVVSVDRGDSCINQWHDLWAGLPVERIPSDQAGRPRPPSHQRIEYEFGERAALRHSNRKSA